MRDRPNRRDFLLHLAPGLVVLVTGALEGWYGRPQLFGDDIAYLDVANMIHLGDWRAALNPLWSLGYPLLLSLVKPFFADTIRGELAAVFTLNIAIYMGSWVSFLCLLKTAQAFLRDNCPEAGNAELTGFVTIAAACVFVTGQVCLGRVSSVGPDELVSCLFFLASAFVLRFIMRPSVGNGVLLGLALGIGYVVKAVFLPLSVMMLTVALLRRGRGTLRTRVAMAAPAALFMLLIPYAAGLSWAFGRVTLGEAAPLNYAFHVNQLPHWMGWQGGPARLGEPIHPVKLLREHPAVFAFGEPFHVTYPPQYNMPYWYDGYRHFFSLPNAARAIFTNLRELEKVLHENTWFVAAWLFSATILISAAFRPARLIGWVEARRAWPVYLPSVLGILLYLQVHLEGRYIAAFLTILAMIPFLVCSRLLPRMARLALPLLAIGTSINLTGQLQPAINLAVHRAALESGGQWAVAQYLTQSGLKPGDKVASVSTLNDIRCTWAYAARLHVVAAIGNDAYDAGLQQQDFNLFWTDPRTQADVLRLFRRQGAVAVIAPAVDASVHPIDPAWRRIPNADAWFLPLQ